MLAPSSSSEVVGPNVAAAAVVVVDVNTEALAITEAAAQIDDDIAIVRYTRSQLVDIRKHRKSLAAPKCMRTLSKLHIARNNLMPLFASFPSAVAAAANTKPVNDAADVGAGDDVDIDHGDNVNAAAAAAAGAEATQIKCVTKNVQFTHDQLMELGMHPMSQAPPKCMRILSKLHIARTNLLPLFAKLPNPGEYQQQQQQQQQQQYRYQYHQQPHSSPDGDQRPSLLSGPRHSHHHQNQPQQQQHSQKNHAQQQQQQHGGSNQKNHQQQQQQQRHSGGKHQQQKGGYGNSGGGGGGGGSNNYGGSAKKDAKPEHLHISLTAKEDVQLNETANAWKPRAVLAADAALAARLASGNKTSAEINNINDGDSKDSSPATTAKATASSTSSNDNAEAALNEPQPDSDDVSTPTPPPPPSAETLAATEKLYMLVRSILNKLTFDNFDVLLEQLKNSNIDTMDKLNGVIGLVFNKAIDEPVFARAYAQLCKSLVENCFPVDAGSRKLFKTTLINRCQHEFLRNVSSGGAAALAAAASDASPPTAATEQQKRRRTVCTVGFIGELYRMGMLTSKIINWCVRDLLDSRSEEKLECLCKLLATVGAMLEKRTGDEQLDEKNYVDLTVYFRQMQQIAECKTKKLKVSNRVRFMLQDCIDLRNNKWEPRRK